MKLSIYQQIFELTKYKINYSKHLFDLFLVTHFLFGVVYSLLFPTSKYLYPIILHTIFEIFENSIGIEIFNEIDKIKYTGDSLINSLGDLVGFMLGVYIGKLINTNKYKNYILAILFLSLGLTIYFLAVKYYNLVLI